MRRRGRIRDRECMGFKDSGTNEDPEVDVLRREPAGVAVWDVNLRQGRVSGRSEVDRKDVPLSLFRRAGREGRP